MLMTQFGKGKGMRVLDVEMEMKTSWIFKGRLPNSDSEWQLPVSKCVTSAGIVFPSFVGEKMGILSSFGQDKRKIKKNPPINIKAIASTGWTPHTCWENMFQLNLNLMRFSVVCVFLLSKKNSRAAGWIYKTLVEASSCCAAAVDIVVPPRK